MRLMHLKFIVKVEPLPCSELTVTEPPIFSRMVLPMERLRPRPYNCLWSLLSRVLKFINKFWRVCSLMPSPWSLIAMSKLRYLTLGLLLLCKPLQSDLHSTGRPLLTDLKTSRSSSALLLTKS